MDIHRSRFVPYPTSAITSLAFSRTSDSGFAGPIPSLKLAIGRANGNVEIWNPLKGSWVQEAVFQGDNKSIDGLAWTQEPNDTDANGQIILGQQRLFSIASSPSVTEWDLATGRPKHQSSGNFSEVWCFAVQPRAKANDSKEPPSQDIVAGCGDGTLVILSTADNSLQFKRILARVSGKKARCMCIAYQKPETVVAGFADSMIRVYDTRTGSQTRTMSFGTGLPTAPKNILVWQVRCLPNGDIVSSDSNGEVRFWDGKTYSLLQRLKGHETDCLDLITSSDGKTIISGSIDGKMAIYKQSNGNGRRNWAKASHRRVHAGEVKAMAAFDSKTMSVVVSGGSDVAPMVTPLREYGKENPRSLPCLPQEAAVTSAPKARLIASWWDKSISIWRIARQANGEAAELQKPRKLIASIALNTKLSVASVAISNDGKLLAASTSSEIKVFQLRKRPDSDALAVRKLEVSNDLAVLGARLVSFSPDGKWLAAVTPDSEIHLARLAADSEKRKQVQFLPETVELERLSRKLPYQTGFKDFDRTVTRLTFSGDSSVLVACDLLGYLDSWALQGNEDITAPAIEKVKRGSDAGSSKAGSDSDSDSDSDDDESTTLFYGQHWVDNPAGHLLPKLDSQALILTFRPQKDIQSQVNGNPGVHATRHNPHAHSHELPEGQHRLWVLTARHQMYEFDVLAGRLSEWSRRNPSAILPESLKLVKDRAMGAVWDSNASSAKTSRERLWIYGSTWLIMLNLSGDLSIGSTSQPLRKRKRKGALAIEDGDDTAAKKAKSESGAGSVIAAHLRPGFADVAKRIEDGKAMDFELNNNLYGQEDELTDNENDDEEEVQLTRLRSHGEEQDDAQANGTESEKRSWYTFKYRPILGIVPLEDDTAEDSSEKVLEVAIVERPLWEALDMKRR
ncbi:Hypothetical protein R9X50_00027800 [Acrodontium crateriforme]|uniref:Wdr1p n=1 Tax=Acrodontium crateriforme TaxID=150365 RepID=A0AAQ3LXS7_9PEZI|nr:Hypothetical protein R9X50_00027800 [Acrodontium crateriforme]